MASTPLLGWCRSNSAGWGAFYRISNRLPGLWAQSPDGAVGAFHGCFPGLSATAGCLARPSCFAARWPVPVRYTSSRSVLWPRKGCRLPFPPRNCPGRCRRALHDIRSCRAVVRQEGLRPGAIRRRRVCRRPGSVCGDLVFSSKVLRIVNVVLFINTKVYKKGICKGRSIVFRV